MLKKLKKKSRFTQSFSKSYLRHFLWNEFLLRGGVHANTEVESTSDRGEGVVAQLAKLPCGTSSLVAVLVPVSVTAPFLPIQLPARASWDAWEDVSASLPLVWEAWSLWFLTRA